jgi:hypothetical protein
MSKIIDIFSFDGKTSSLQIKFDLTSDLVDLYWIIDSSVDNSLQELIKNNFQYLTDKISIIPNVSLQIYDEKLANLFVTKNVKFDDIIIISKIDEIYTKDIIDSLDLHLPFSAQILPVYESDKNLQITNSESLLGPVIMYRTQYTKYPRYTNNILSKKSGYIRVDKNESVLDHGFKIIITNENSNFTFILD